MSDCHSKNQISAIDWNAVYTRHQHEKVVALALAKNGFEVFLPTYNAIRQWTDRKKRITLPLFPCYIFVRANTDKEFRILPVPGAYYFVTFAGERAVISNVEIDFIRRTVESGLAAEPHPFLECGDWVRVVSGPLLGIEGILVRKKGTYQLILSTQSLGKSIAVEIDAFSVRAIQKRTPQLFVSDRRSYSSEHRITG